MLRSRHRRQRRARIARRWLRCSIWHSHFTGLHGGAQRREQRGRLGGSPLIQASAPLAHRIYDWPAQMGGSPRQGTVPKILLARALMVAAPAAGSRHHKRRLFSSTPGVTRPAVFSPPLVSEEQVGVTKVGVTNDGLKDKECWRRLRESWGNDSVMMVGTDMSRQTMVSLSALAGDDWVHKPKWIPGREQSPTVAVG